MPGLRLAAARATVTSIAAPSATQPMERPGRAMARERAGPAGVNGSDRGATCATSAPGGRPRRRRGGAGTSRFASRAAPTACRLQPELAQLRQRDHAMLAAASSPIDRIPRAWAVVPVDIARK